MTTPVTYTYNAVDADFIITPYQYNIAFNVNNNDSRWGPFLGMQINTDSTILFTKEILTGIFITNNLIQGDNIKYVDTANISGAQVTGIDPNHYYSLYDVIIKIIYNINSPTSSYATFTNNFPIDNTKAFKTCIGTNQTGLTYELRHAKNINGQLITIPLNATFNSFLNNNDILEFYVNFQFFNTSQLIDTSVLSTNTVNIPFKLSFKYNYFSAPPTQ
jgi:hypothetical protein